MKNPPLFPTDFLWGTATAAHQIEGGNVDSDWWDFEKLPGRVKNGEKSGAASGHWNRVPEDIALMRDLGVNSYRFSIEWAKIEPREGQLDRAAIEHYCRELALLADAGIEPMITLHHFTSPRWFRERGGWAWAGAAAAFGGYAKLIATSVAPRCRLWCTVNEPMVHLGGGYLAGLMPPELRGWGRLRAPLLGLLAAHVAAYRAIHAIIPAAAVGMAHHLRPFAPKNFWNPLDRLLASTLDDAFNWALPRAMETGHLRLRLAPFFGIEEELPELLGTQDFFGVNYYTLDRLTLGKKDGRIEPIPSPPPDLPVSDLNWAVDPENFRRVLENVAKLAPAKPIHVTENGIADAADSRRADFLRGHLSVLARAIADGLPVRSYYHWSLMDNFEWIEGFGPRFGLYAVDYSTLKRSARASAGVYSEIIRTRGASLGPATRDEL